MSALLMLAVQTQHRHPLQRILRLLNLFPHQSPNHPCPPHLPVLLSVLAEVAALEMADAPTRLIAAPNGAGAERQEPTVANGQPEVCRLYVVTAMLATESVKIQIIVAQSLVFAELEVVTVVSRPLSEHAEVASAETAFVPTPSTAVLSLGTAGVTRHTVPTQRLLSDRAAVELWGMGFVKTPVIAVLMRVTVELEAHIVALPELAVVERLEMASVRTPNFVVLRQDIVEIPLPTVGTKLRFPLRANRRLAQLYTRRSILSTVLCNALTDVQLVVLLLALMVVRHWR